jgi:hypothetical protein
MPPRKKSRQKRPAAAQSQSKARCYLFSLVHLTTSLWL